MKARMKTTGETVDVVSFSPDGEYINYINSTGLVIKRTYKNGQSLYNDFVLLPNGYKKEEDIDWEQRRYEIAKDILCATINSCGKCLPSQSVGYADMLIEELKNGKEAIPFHPKYMIFDRVEFKSDSFNMPMIGKIEEAITRITKGGVEYCYTVRGEDGSVQSKKEEDIINKL